MPPAKATGVDAPLTALLAALRLSHLSDASAAAPPSASAQTLVAATTPAAASAASAAATIDGGVPPAAPPLAGATLEELQRLNALGRPKLLAHLKECGVGRLVERQAIAVALSKMARGEDVVGSGGGGSSGVAGAAGAGGSGGQGRLAPILDCSLAKDVGGHGLNVHAPQIANELVALPAFGKPSNSYLLPGESASAAKPGARVRLICFYGASDSAAGLSEWQRRAPSWLEVRAVELPGHGARAAEGVWPLGRRDAAPTPDDDAIASSIRRERAAAVAHLANLIAPLCDGHYALYGFSSGAMLAYLVTLELQARANANANTNASDARAVRRLPFRLIVCGRGAPHCVHTSMDFWRVARCGSDDEFMRMLNKTIAVPLPQAGEDAGGDDGESHLARMAALWRAAIVPAMVHCGDEPRLPRGGGNGGEMSPFPLPPSESSTPELAGRAYVHASGAAAVSCCPLIAIGSTTDRVWPWGLPARWSDVAAAGFRCEEVEAVAHFKLMADAKVVDKVQRELAAAALVQARWA